MPGHIRTCIARSHTLSAIATTLLLTGFTLKAEAQIRFELPAEPLSQALTTLGSLANLNIYFDPSTVDGIRSPAIKAELSADDALTRLLEGTRLRAVRVDENTVRVVPVVTKDAQRPHERSTGSTYTAPPMHLASANITAVPGGSGGGSIPDNPTDNQQSGDSTNFRLTEVVVTAQKRSENLRDVPVPVTAISADTLVSQNELRLQDYYTSIPGLSMTSGDSHGSPQLSIRGVTTGGEINPTVGVVVDDVPYGSSQYLGYIVPDIDPSDLARVEVLRGPQGTLYGASSIGGLVKFVTQDPSTERLSGRIQAGTSSVYDGGSLGYSVRGSVNVPITDTIAVRASGFTREDPGYVDNVESGQRDVNKTTVAGGHVSALWKPSQALSVKLSALLQQSNSHGSPDVEPQPGLSGLQQAMLRGTGGVTLKSEVYSAVVNAEVGPATLTSVSGYSLNSFSDSLDETVGLGFLPTQAQFGVNGVSEWNRYRTEKFTQEIRSSMKLGSHVDWLLGGFYSHENTPFTTDVLAIDQATGAPVGLWLTLPSPLSFKEYAVFTDFTVHVTDNFDVQFGGRESENHQTYALSYIGPFDEVALGLPSPVVHPAVHTKEDSFTYLVTPKYKLSPDLMVYARLASGYRPGGPNATPGAGVPANYSPDTTKTYELGVKGTSPSHVISFDASLYYIDWKNIQLNLLTAQGLGFTGNGSRAKSQGVELSTEARPLPGLTLSGWVAWNDAVLTEAFPTNSSALAQSGDRLPFSSRYSGTISADESFPLFGQAAAFVGGSISYIGNREGNFASIYATSPARQYYPAYTRVDLHAGVRNDAWTVSLFANNVSNEKGPLKSGLDNNPSNGILYLQPRTIGISATRSF
jgi:iron complex outermembrane recepter protein